jgi:hypothetical protein
MACVPADQRQNSVYIFLQKYILINLLDKNTKKVLQQKSNLPEFHYWGGQTTKQGWIIFKCKQQKYRFSKRLQNAENKASLFPRHISQFWMHRAQLAW